MASTSDDTPDGAAAHPVAAFATRAREVIDNVTAASSRPVWAMTPAEQRQALVDLAALEAQVAALRLDVLTEADRSQACTTEGDRSAAEWVARRTRQRRPHARADLHLARTLDTTRPATRTALAAGVVNLDQARSIVRALDELPTTGPDAVTPEQTASAEAFLLTHAQHHDARDLAVLGRRLWEVIAPDDAEQREGRALAAQERAAARRMMFEIREDDDGLCHGRFRIPALHGAIITKALQALMSPARPHPETTGDDQAEPVDATPPARQRPHAVRRGEAFCELLEALSARDLPTAAGGDATVVVTMTLDDLTTRLKEAGVATLDTGHHLSAGEARRLACRHRLIPAVLGGRSEPLDLGRSRRLHTKAQRLAMSLTQGGCTAEHCDAPPAMCHAHHDIAWSRGGPTDLTHGRLLCGHHHRRIHDPAYETRRLPDGRLTFHRREWSD